MARQLRIDLAGGWYHVTARGNERKAIFREERDCEHFLELWEEGAERYALLLRAYMLMPNHYHLIVETPRANLSAVTPHHCIYGSVGMAVHRFGQLLQVNESLRKMYDQVVKQL